MMMGCIMELNWRKNLCNFCRVTVCFSSSLFLMLSIVIDRGKLIRAKERIVKDMDKNDRKVCCDLEGRQRGVRVKNW